MIITPLKDTDVCRRLRDDHSADCYFLTVDKKPAKVTNIEKTRYAGKIYDVDVPSDVILVRRNGTAVWSGNSNNVVVDVSKYGHNGIVYGANWTGQGRFGGAYVFGGSDVFVDCGNVSLGGLFTVEAWFSRSEAGVSGFVAGREGDYLLGFDGALDRLYFDYYYGSSWAGRVYSNTSYTDDSWHHVAVSCDRGGGVVHIFVDGFECLLTWFYLFRLQVSVKGFVLKDAFGFFRLEMFINSRFL